NEPQQYILLNSWIVERWKDELLYWDLEQFEGISEIMLPRESVWIPDTTLYNSLVMDDAESRRILNVKVNTLPTDKSALVEMLYPTLYQFSCMLDLRFFPFDIQHCLMTFGSWTHDNKNIDYFAYDDISDKIIPTLLSFNLNEQESPTKGGIGIDNCIPNEGWNVLSTDVSRREVKFHCCQNNYTLLEFKLHIQRKPLFYLVNLIIPTSIITLIAIVGFFSSSTVNDAREEKISLGITTLLSMSILIFMVSDQMPSTSSFIPLIGWFYTSMMGLISGGTLASSFVIYVQKKGIIGQRPSRQTMRWARIFGRFIWMEMPLLMKQAYALKEKQDKLQKLRLQWEQIKRQKRQSQINGNINSSPRRPNWLPKSWQTRPGNLGNNNNLTTKFVGPTLGNAMAFLIPKQQFNDDSRENTLKKKISGAESLPENLSVNYLNSPPSKIEEEDFDNLSIRSTTKSFNSDKEIDKIKIKREESPYSINLIEMEEEEEEINEITPFNKENKEKIKKFNENKQNNFLKENNTKLNLSNPFVANAAVFTPMTEYAQSLLQKVQSKEREKILSQIEYRRRGCKGPKMSSVFRNSLTSSMIDLSTNDYLNGFLNNQIIENNNTKNEPQIQRNLAEIEYDWLAAVIERMFLILFSSLFFLMSFGINGIGLYYWYFTYVDMVEKS
uniref:Neur_chan_LBD domain-containing protein n=1 Tax=Meloidogyne hapla TaxID=6305 RepID=A0A1I8BKC5_MELHA